MADKDFIISQEDIQKALNPNPTDPGQATSKPPAAFTPITAEDIAKVIPGNFTGGEGALGTQGDTPFRPSEFNDYMSLKTGADPYQNIDIRAELQPEGEKLLYGAGRLIGTTLTKLLESPGFAVGSVNALIQQDSSKIYDNMWVNAVASTEESLKEVMPLYKRRDVMEGNLLNKLSSLSWWMDDVVDGLAFLGSMMVPGFAYMKAGGIGGKLAKAIAHNTRLAKMGIVSAGETVQASKMFGIGLKQLGHELDLAALTMFNTVNEAGFEAKDTKESILQALAPYVRAGKMTQAEAEEKAAKGAVNVFRHNFGILLPSNYLMNTFLFRKFNPSRGSIKKLLKDGVPQVDEIVPLTLKQKIGEFGKGAVVSMASEGLWEENAQLAAQNYEKAIALEDPEFLDMSAVQGIASEMINNLETDEGQEAIALGAIIGFIPGAVGGVRQAQAKNKALRGAVDLLNLANAQFGPTAKNWIMRDSKGNVMIDPESGNPVMNIEAIEASIKTKLSEQARSFLKVLAKIQNKDVHFEYLKSMDVANMLWNYLQEEDGAEYAKSYIESIYRDRKENGDQYGDDDLAGNQRTLEQEKADLMKTVDEMSRFMGFVQQDSVIAQYEDKYGEAFTENLKQGLFLAGSNQVFWGRAVRELEQRKARFESDEEIPGKEKLLEKANEDLKFAQAELERNKKFIRKISDPAFIDLLYNHNLRKVKKYEADKKAAEQKAKNEETVKENVDNPVEDKPKYGKAKDPVKSRKTNKRPAHEQKSGFTSPSELKELLGHNIKDDVDLSAEITDELPFPTETGEITFGPPKKDTPEDKEAEESPQSPKKVQLVTNPSNGLIYSVNEDGIIRNTASGKVINPKSTVGRQVLRELNGTQENEQEKEDLGIDDAEKSKIRLLAEEITAIDLATASNEEIENGKFAAMEYISMRVDEEEPYPGADDGVNTFFEQADSFVQPAGSDLNARERDLETVNNNSEIKDTFGLSQEQPLLSGQFITEENIADLFPDVAAELRAEEVRAVTNATQGIASFGMKEKELENIYLLEQLDELNFADVHLVNPDASVSSVDEMDHLIMEEIMRREAEDPSMVTAMLKEAGFTGEFNPTLEHTLNEEIPSNSKSPEPVPDEKKEELHFSWKNAKLSNSKAHYKTVTLNEEDSSRRFVVLDENDKPVPKDAPTVNGKPLKMDPHILADPDITEVELILIETDWWIKNRDSIPEAERWHKAPIMMVARDRKGNPHFIDQLAAHDPQSTGSKRYESREDVYNALLAGKKVVGALEKYAPNTNVMNMRRLNPDQRRFARLATLRAGYTWIEEQGPTGPRIVTEGTADAPIILGYVKASPHRKGKPTVVVPSHYKVSPNVMRWISSKLQEEMPIEQGGQVYLVRPDVDGQPRLFKMSTRNLDGKAIDRIKELIVDRKYDALVEIINTFQPFDLMEYTDHYFSIKTYEAGKDKDGNVMETLFINFQHPTENQVIGITVPEMQKAIAGKPYKAHYVNPETKRKGRSLNPKTEDVVKLFEESLRQKKYQIDGSKLNTPDPYVSQITGKEYKEGYNEYLMSPDEHEDGLGIVAHDIYNDRGSLFFNITADITEIGIEDEAGDSETVEDVVLPRPNLSGTAPGKSTSRPRNLTIEDEDDAPFRSVRKKDYTRMNKAEASAWLRQRLPEIPVSFFDHAFEIANSGGAFAHGYFKQGAIHLANNGEVGTEYHEAFHAVFRMFLTSAQRAQILNEAARHFGRVRAKEGESGSLVDRSLQAQQVDDVIDQQVLAFLANHQIYIQNIRDLGSNAPGFINEASRIAGVKNRTQFDKASSEFIASILMADAQFENIVAQLEEVGKFKDIKGGNKRRQAIKDTIASIVNKKLTYARARQEGIGPRLWSQIKELIDKIIAMLNRIGELEEAIDRQMALIMKSGELISTNPRPGFTPMEFMEQLGSSDMAREVILTLGDKEEVQLTGSLALSVQGPVWRKGGKPHDLDYRTILRPKEADKFMDGLYGERSQKIWEFPVRTFEKGKKRVVIVNTYIIGQDTSNMSKEEIQEMKEQIAAEIERARASHISYNPDNVKYPTIQVDLFSQMDRNVGPFIDHKFKYDRKDQVVRMSRYDTPFNAKLEMVRYKDMMDYATFQPYDPAKPQNYASDLELEELLAEAFRDYVITQKAPKTLGQKIAKFFRDLWNYITTYLSDRRTIDQLFSNIESGHINKEFKRNISNLSDEPVYRVRPGRSWDYEIQKRLVEALKIATISTAQQRQDKRKERIRLLKEQGITKKVRNVTLKGILDGEWVGEKGNRKYIKGVKDHFLTFAWEDVNTGANPTFEEAKSYLDGAPLPENMQPHKFSEAFIDVYTGWNDTISENGQNVDMPGWRTLVKRALRSAGYRVEEEEEIMETADGYEKIYARSHFEEDVRDRLSAELKFRLESIPYKIKGATTKDDNVIDPELQFYVYVPSDRLYNELYNTLMNVQGGYGHMRAALEQKAAYNDEIRSFLLELDAWPDQLKAQFYTAFRVNHQNFVTVLEDFEWDNIEQKWYRTMKIADPSAEGIDKRTLARWVNQAVDKSGKRTDALYRTVTDPETQEPVIKARSKQVKQARKLWNRIKNAHRDKSLTDAHITDSHQLLETLGIDINIDMYRQFLALGMDVGTVRVTGQELFLQLFSGSKITLENVIGALEEDPFVNIFTEYKTFLTRFSLPEKMLGSQPQLAFRNPAGKTIFPVNLPSTLSNFINQGKQRKLDRTRFEYDPLFKPSRDNDVYSSPYFRALFDEVDHGEEDFRNLLKAEDLDSLNNKDREPVEYINVAENYTRKLRYLMYVNNGNENVRKFAFPVLADRGRMIFITVPHLDSKIEGWKAKMPNLDHYITGLIVQDINKIKQAIRDTEPVEKGGLEDGELIPGYHYKKGSDPRARDGKAFKFEQVNLDVGLDHPVMRESTDAKLREGGQLEEVNKLVAEVKKQLRGYAQKQFELLKADKEFTSDMPKNWRASLDTKRVRDYTDDLMQLAWNYTIDNFIFKNEITKFIAGHKAFYKDAPTSTKRMGGVETTGKELFEARWSNDGRYGASSTYNVAFTADLTSEFPEYLDELRKGIVDSRKARYGEEGTSIIFTANFVNDRQEILDRFPPRHENVYAEHATFAFRPENLNDITPGKTSTLRVIARVFDDNADALIVEGMERSDGKPAHITLSTAEGVKPFYSNELIAKGIDGDESVTMETFVDKPFNIEVTAGYFNGNTNVFDRKKEEPPSSESIDEIIKAYEKLMDPADTTGTDGFGVISIHEQRGIMMGQGTWRMDHHERAYENYIAAPEGEKIFAYTDENGNEQRPVLSPNKPYHDGVETYKGTARRVIIKNSTMVLLEEFTKDFPQIDAVRRRMEAPETAERPRVDATVMITAAKATYWNVNDFTDPDNFKVVTLSREHMRIAQNVPDHSEKSPKRNVQINKNILNDLQMDGVYVLNRGIKGKEVRLTGKQIYDLYQGINIEMLGQSLTSLHQRLGYDPEKKGDRLQFLKKMRFVLEDAVEKRELPDNYRRALDLFFDPATGKWDFGTPLSFPAYYRTFENLIYSLFKNDVMVQRINGKGVVQVAELGSHKESKDLKFVRNVDGEVLHAEVALSYSLAATLGLKPGDDLSSLPEELTRMIGYRIPNQGKNSMLPMKIKYLFPEENGKVIMVPKHITIQMGSDFDVDKIWLIMPNYEVKNELRFVQSYVSERTGEDFHLNKENREKIKAIRNNPEEGFAPESEEFYIASALQVFKGASTNEKVISKVEFNPFEPLQRQSREALENGLFEIMEAILLNPAHFEEMVTPLDSEELGNLKKMAMERDPSLTEEMDYNDPEFEIQMEMRNKAGALGIGTYANLLSGTMIRQFGEVTLSAAYRPSIIMEDGKQHVFSNLSGVRVDRVVDSDRPLISQEVSGRLSSSVDNSKDPKMTFLNDNELTQPVIGVLLGLGLNNRIITYFVNQPIIRELTKEYFAQNATPFKLKKIANEVGGRFREGFNVHEHENVTPMSYVQLEQDAWTPMRPAISLDQADILGNFILLHEAGQELQKANKILNTDSINDMSTTGAIQSFMDDVEYFRRGSDIINGLQPFIDGEVYPMSKAFREHVLEAAMEFSSEFFPFIPEKDEDGNAFTAAKQLMRAQLGITKLSKDQHQAFNDAAFIYLLARPGSPFESIFTEEQLKRLVMSDEGMPAILNQLLADVPSLRKNPFVALLKEPEWNANPKRNTKLLMLENSVKLTPEVMNEVQEGFIGLLEHKEAKVRRFAHQLIAYSILHNGFSKTYGSFIDLVPVEMWDGRLESRAIAMASYFRDAIKELRDTEILIPFIDEFIRHNVTLKGLVQVVPRKNIKHGKGKGVIKFQKQDENIYSSKMYKQGYNGYRRYIRSQDKNKRWRLYRHWKFSGTQVLYAEISPKGIKNQHIEYLLRDETGVPHIQSVNPLNDIGHKEKDDWIDTKLDTGPVDKDSREAVAKDFSKEAIENIAARMRERFANVQIDTIDDPSQVFAGRFRPDGTAIVNLYYAGGDTVFHEVAHPFVELIFKDNPELFWRLAQDLIKHPWILEFVKKKYPELRGTSLLKEGMATAIGLYAAENTQNMMGAPLVDSVYKVLERLKGYNAKLWDREFTITPANLARTTTLEQIGEYFAVGESRFDWLAPDNEVFSKAEEKHSEKVSEYIKEMLISIQAQIEIVKRRGSVEGDPGPELTRLEKLKNEVSTLKELDAMAKYVDEAYKKSIEIGRDIKDVLADPEVSDKDKVLKLRNAILFTSEFKFLDTLQKRLGEQKIGLTIEEEDERLEERPDVNQVQRKLDKAQSNRAAIESIVTKRGIPIMARWLLAADTGLAQEYARSIERDDLVVTQERMEELLREAEKDINLWRSLLDPMISSPDAALALFAKQVKHKLLDAQNDDRMLEDRIGDAVKKYKQATGLSDNNVEKFNSAILERVKRYHFNPETKEMVGEDHWQFVEKYDYQRWQEAKNKFFADMKKDGVKPGSSTWATKTARWYEKNSVPLEKEEIEKIVDQKKRSMREDQYNEWYNAHFSKGGRPMKGLTRPTDEYINSRWKELYDKDGNPIGPAGEYHKEMTDIYRELQENLPEMYKPYMKLPSIRKSSLDRAIEQSPLKALREAWRERVDFLATDERYGTTLPDGSKLSDVPVYYNAPIDADDVSLDVPAVIMKYAKMSNKYRHLSSIHGYVSLMKTIMADRKIRVTDSKGNNIKSRIATILGFTNFDIIPPTGSKNSLAMFNDFVDRIYYGQMYERETAGKYSLDKIGDAIITFTAMNALAGNLTQAVNNVAIGKILITAEAAAGRWIPKTALKKGMQFYFNHVPGMMGDFGKITDKSLVTQIIDMYDPIQGEFTSQYGTQVSGSVLKKLFNHDTMFFLQHAGEHMMQVSTLFALMANTTVKDENGRDITLLEAYELDEKGKIRLKKGVKWSKEQRYALMDRLHGINKYLHGTYNSFDKGRINKWVGGRMILLFRNWVRPGWIRRWGQTQVDYEIDDVIEGNYRSFWRMFTRDFKEYGFNMAARFHSLNPHEKAGAIKTIYEMSWFLSVSALIYALSYLESDDDKEPWAYNFTMYQLLRLRSELLFFVHIGEAWKIIRTPTALMSTLSQLMRLTVQLSDPLGKYERDSGFNEKGDNKLLARLRKLIPILGTIERAASPEQAMTWFKSGVLFSNQD